MRGLKLIQSTLWIMWEMLKFSSIPCWGVISARMRKVRGFINSIPVTVLIDSCSIHSFLNENLAKVLHKFVAHQNGLRIVAANGEKNS